MLTAEDIFGGLQTQPIEVTPPGATKSVWIRYPTFAEWYGIVAEQRKLEDAQPTAELVAKTVATCLSDKDGKRILTDADAVVLLETKPQPVAWLYKTCWDTVLADGEDAVGEAAKK
jgi:hypothetical protein